MKFIRDGWALILTVVTLVVVPHDSWAFWFSEQEGSWYGETWIEGDDNSGVIVVAKNATEEPVLLHSIPNQRVAFVASMRLKPKEPNWGHSDALEVPSYSYQIIKYQEKLESLPDSRKLKKTGRFLKVSELQVATPAEKDLSTVYSLLSAAGLAVVSFAIGLFASQAAPLQEHENLEQN